jgi:hypothetical protein
MGADVAPPTQAELVLELQRQINRFVPGYVKVAVPQNGVADPATLVAAAQLLQLRALLAFSTDQYSSDAKALLAKATSVLRSPLLLLTDLPSAIEILTLFGDMRGLPSASRGSTLRRLVSDKRVMAGAAALVGALVFLRRKEKR